MTSGASRGDALRTQRRWHSAPAGNESPDTNREGAIRQKLKPRDVLQNKWPVHLERCLCDGTQKKHE